MYGRVVNKHARYNLCYDTEAQEPSYEEGKGRIIALGTIPRTKALLEELGKRVGPKFENLKMEGIGIIVINAVLGTMAIRNGYGYVGFG
jgi:hypothetical protein